MKKELTYLGFILLGILIVPGVSRTVSAEPMITIGMLKADPDGMPGETKCQGEADMGGGIKVPFSLEVTTKGNGTLKIANLQLHVFDEGGSGRGFKNGLLTIEIVGLHLDGKGGKYMVISGAAIHQEGKEADPNIPEGVVFIYHFDAKTKQFERVYKHASFEIEM